MKDRKNTRIVFMGTPAFAVPSLEKLLHAGYDIAAVVTVPDKPAGRGLKNAESPVKKFARENGLHVLQPVKLKDPSFLQELKRIKPDIQVVVAFRMLPEEVWKLPDYGTFNLHASLLPAYRGAAPIQRAIMNGEEKTGLTTFLLDQKIDTGAILYQVDILVSPDETAGSLHDKMLEPGAELVLKTCDDLVSERVSPEPQPEKDAGSHPAAPKIFRDDCRINWAEGAYKVYNQIRGLSPYPGAFSTLYRKGELLGEIKFFNAQYATGISGLNPGKCRTTEEGRLIIGTPDGWIAPGEVQLSGRKRMNINDLMNGLRWNDLDFYFG